MKKLLTILTVLMFSLATLTQAIASPSALFQQKPHLTKDGKPDRRYKEHKSDNKPVLRKDGKPDMRYKKSQEHAKADKKIIKDHKHDEKKK